jgi:hypothetical protein
VACLAIAQVGVSPDSSVSVKMATGHGFVKECWYERMFLAVLGVAASVTLAPAQELTVGPVALKLGEPESALVQALRKDYDVQRIEGGWSIQPLQRSPTAPGIGVRTLDGRIQAVSFTWGPGFTPPTADIAVQLAHALPDGAKCDVRNVTRFQEGETVRTLEWLCGSYKVGLVTGVSSDRSNSASISIDRLK